jgi:hypothetical protein
MALRSDVLDAYIEHEMAVAKGRFRSRIAMLAAASVVLDLVAAAVALVSEHGAPRAFDTYLDALFWTTTQLLTVSSQLPNPISTPARVLDIGLQAWAISVVAILAGSFASFFLRRSNEMDPPGA